MSPSSANKVYPDEQLHLFSQISARLTSAAPLTKESAASPVETGVCLRSYKIFCPRLPSVLLRNYSAEIHQKQAVSGTAVLHCPNHNTGGTPPAGVNVVNGVVQ